MYMVESLFYIRTIVAARTQRWGMALSIYDYDIRYKAGKKLLNADALWRLPLSGQGTGEVMKCFSCVKEIPLSYKDIGRETIKDPTMSKVLDYVKYGWPERKQWEEDVLPCFKIREHLNVDMSCIIFKNRVIVPRYLRIKVLNLLHGQHPGVVKM